MRLSQLHRSLTFRIALLYLVLFTASVALLVGVVWLAGVAQPLAGLKRQAQTDSAAALAVYRAGGLPALTARLHAPVQPPAEPFRALIAADGTPLVGFAPTRMVAQGPVSRIEFPDADGTGARDAVVVATKLSGGETLIVGHDVERLEDREELILQALAWSAVIAPSLGLIVGLAMSLAVSRRIEAVVATAHAVMEGDLSRRVEVRGAGDDFDHLAETLNRMLARIDALVQSVRSVSDHIAHELRTPLTRLRAELEALGAERALQEADRLQSIFDALLRIARIEAGRHGAALAPLDLSGLLTDAAELYQPEAEAKGAALVTDLSPGLTVAGDRDLLFQAVCNLIDNAVKHTPAGGQISVVARTEGRGVEVVVADTGPGVPADQRGRVVERFGRLARDKDKPGLGLGLPLVAAVAGLHGGALALGDAAPGLRASLSLPA